MSRLMLGFTRCGNTIPRYPQNEVTISPIITRAWRAMPDADKPYM